MVWTWPSPAELSAHLASLLLPAEPAPPASAPPPLRAPPPVSAPPPEAEPAADADEDLLSELLALEERLDA